MSRLKEAAKKLVAKLEELRNDSEYQSVWTLYNIHGFIYKGPTYFEELDELKDALENDNA